MNTIYKKLQQLITSDRQVLNNNIFKRSNQSLKLSYKKNRILHMLKYSKNDWNFPNCQKDTQQSFNEDRAINQNILNACSDINLENLYKKGIQFLQKTSNKQVQNYNLHVNLYQLSQNHPKIQQNAECLQKCVEIGHKLYTAQQIDKFYYHQLVKRLIQEYFKNHLYQKCQYLITNYLALFQLDENGFSIQIAHAKYMEGLVYKKMEQYEKSIIAWQTALQLTKEIKSKDLNFNKVLSQLLQQFLKPYQILKFRREYLKLKQKVKPNHILLSCPTISTLSLSPRSILVLDQSRSHQVEVMPQE